MATTLHELALENLQLQKGDIVKITHSVPSRNGGWTNSWVDNMDNFIGKNMKVLSINSNNGVALDSLEPGDYFYAYPAHCLEIVSRVPKISYKKVKLNSLYDANIGSDGTIEVGCQTFSIDDVRRIIKEFDKLQTS